jgi:hypothetical protein
VLKQHKHQAENRDRGEKTELKILPAVKKVVEVPVILSPGTDCNQQNREPNEDTTSHGTGLKGPVPERSIRTGYLLQSILSISHNFIRSGRSGGPGLEGISNSVSTRTESIVSGVATTQSEPDNWHRFCWKSDSALCRQAEQGLRELHFFSSGCSETLKIFPSGSLNQATFAPVGEVQMPSSSWCIPS